MTQCGRCGMPLPDRTPKPPRYLCELCDSTIIRAISLYPSLVADLRRSMAGIKAVPTDRVRVDGTTEPRLGFDEKLSERAHSLYAEVANWCVGWALALDIPAPDHLLDYGHANAVTRLPTGYLEWLAPIRVAAWLTKNHDRIAEHPEVGEYAVLVTDKIANEARALGYRPSPRRVREKRCRTCHSETLRLRWPIDGEPTLYCTACGGEWPCGPVLSRAVLQGQ